MKVQVKTPSSPAPLSGPALAKAKAPAKAKLLALAPDHQAATKKGQANKPAAPSAPEGIRTEFPLHDLGAITTRGREAQGFRLDSGSLRYMSLTARRIVDQGTPGFEITFQARGPARQSYRQRLEQKGAVPSRFAFSSSQVEEAAAGKAALRLAEVPWAPNQKEDALKLEKPGEWCVELGTDSCHSEALKGLMRIRVYGSDADATAALNDAIHTLGLQSAFAPPTEQAQARLKALRLLWQARPQASDGLGRRSLETLAPAIEQALQAADLYTGQEIKLSPALAGEMNLLFQESRALYFDWAQGYASYLSGAQQHLALTAIEDRLTQLGIPPGAPEREAAKLSEVPAPRQKALTDLALLTAGDRLAAEALTARDVESLKPKELEAALESAGIPKLSERLQQLELAEVYPGFFTVLDPALAQEAGAAGARYLYSTADDAGRVAQILKAGQKSSVTRFGEGLLIPGKSSDDDLGTGGATSVFSRLVTASVIDQARRAQAFSPALQEKTKDQTTFNDWDGTRPYKLILDRSVLGRTDWYGYTADKFGSTKLMRPQNRGVAIIQAIDRDYGKSNEIMFPVGNAPRFLRGVSAPSEEHKAELIAELQQQGISEINGRSLEEAIIVSPGFFMLPEDRTPAVAAEDGVYAAGLAPTIAAALNVGLEAAAQALDPALEERVGTLLASSGEPLLKQAAEQCLSSALDGAATAAAEKAIAALKKAPLNKLRAELEAGLLAAAEVGVRAYYSNPAKYRTLDQLAEKRLGPTLKAGLEAAAEEAIEAALGGAKTGPKALLESAAGEAVRAAIAAKLAADGPAAVAEAVTILRDNDLAHGGELTARTAARQALQASLVAQLDPAVRAGLETQAQARMTKHLRAELEESLDVHGAAPFADFLRGSAQGTQLLAEVRALAQSTAQAPAEAALVEAASEAAIAAGRAAAHSFAAAQGTPLGPDALAEIDQASRGALLGVLGCELREATLTVAEAKTSAALSAGVVAYLDQAKKALFIDHVIEKDSQRVLGENLELELQRICLDSLEGKLDALAAKLGGEADPALLAKLTGPCLARLAKALEAEVMESLKWSIAGRVA